METDRAELIGALSGYYIQTRYPEEVESLGQKVDHESAAQVLQQSEEIVKWLLSMLK
jgi:HEPN domain-containing protein